MSVRGNKIINISSGDRGHQTGAPSRTRPVGHFARNIRAHIAVERVRNAVSGNAVSDSCIRATRACLTRSARITAECGGARCGAVMSRAPLVARRAAGARPAAASVAPAVRTRGSRPRAPGWRPAAPGTRPPPHAELSSRPTSHHIPPSRDAFWLPSPCAPPRLVCSMCCLCKRSGEGHAPGPRCSLVSVSRFRWPVYAPRLRGGGPRSWRAWAWRRARCETARTCRPRKRQRSPLPARSPSPLAVSFCNNQTEHISIH